MVINLSSVPLQDAMYSALGKGRNYAVSLTVTMLPITDILISVQKAIVSWPERAAEEAQQKIVTFLYLVYLDKQDTEM
jgi:hypothetical protein